MAFKINISGKDGKTFHLESESEELNGKELQNKVKGEDISVDLKGYELEITGASDKAGFTAMVDVEGIGLKKVLLGYGKGMHIKPKGDKKKNTQPKGLRLRKTVRGKIISPAISQINLKVIKQGEKKLEEIFPDQGQPKEKENRKSKRKQKEKKPEEAPKEEPKPEEKSIEEKKEEKKEQ